MELLFVLTFILLKLYIMDCTFPFPKLSFFLWQIDYWWCFQWSHPFQVSLNCKLNLTNRIWDFDACKLSCPKHKFSGSAHGWTMWSVQNVHCLGNVIVLDKKVSLHDRKRRTAHTVCRIIGVGGGRGGYTCSGPGGTPVIGPDSDIQPPSQKTDLRPEFSGTPPPPPPPPRADKQTKNITDFRTRAVTTGLNKPLLCSRFSLWREKLETCRHWLMHWNTSKL